MKLTESKLLLRMVEVILRRVKQFSKPDVPDVIKCLMRVVKLDLMLTSYQKNDQDTLLISIIAPGAEIREGYENVIIKNKDGLVFSGFLLEETKSHTTLRELSGASKFFRNSEINSKISTGVSLMPNGLLNGLNEVQLKNLFAYLRSTTPPF